MNAETVKPAKETDEYAPTTTRFALTLPRLWALTTVVVVFVLASRWDIAGIDYWWHVRVGQLIVEQRQIPATDLFSFTRAGQPWVNQSWLMEVLWFVVLQAGGLPLTVFVHTVMITAAYAAILGASRLSAQGNLRWAALATLAAAIGSPNWNIRPQTLSILLFALTVLLLERHTVRSSRSDQSLTADPLLWLLPPAFLVWANGHGGFVFGLLLILADLVAHLWMWNRQRKPFPRQLTAVVAASTLAILATPLGIKMVDYILGFMRHPATQLYNMEFMSYTVRSPDGVLFFAFVGLFLIILLSSGYRLTAREALRLMVFGLLALLARRNGIWFCFVAAPTLAAGLQALSQHQGSRGRPWLNRTVAALLLVAVVLHLPWLRYRLADLYSGRSSFVSSETPVEAVAFLCNIPTANRVFNNQGYGSYMIWACPSKPVFVDSRFELYPIEQWEDYLAVSAARYDWQQILDAYQIDSLLLNKVSQKNLIEAVAGSSAWTQLYQDDQTVVFERAASPN